MMLYVLKSSTLKDAIDPGPKDDGMDELPIIMT